jgi:UDPglucose--hexose-1-phosphate uridylyltransferase
MTGKATAHRRFNPLSRRWILVSADRLTRPWQGQRDAPPTVSAAPYDPTCYLCPGNQRAHGLVNPRFVEPWAFDNDYPALEPTGPPAPASPHPLLTAAPAAGRCRVLCYSPAHDASFATMTVAQIAAVVDAWAEETRRLSAAPGVLHVQIFENRGEMMGASSPHPHCQIWSTTFVPDEVDAEWRSQHDYHASAGSDLLGDYLQQEEHLGERLIAACGAWVAVVPYWAAWPFETLLVPRRLVGALDDLEPYERRDLAALLSTLVRAYDGLFGVPFPYTMGVHAPPTADDRRIGRLHVHFYPPLLRSATVRKFMVGFELFGMPQRDFLPEHAAQRLRERLPARSSM